MISYIRQSQILNPDRAAATHVTICGCGTVGSNAAMQLAKAGIGSLTLIDYDDVEAHNIPSQEFGVAHVGMNKAEALAIRIQELFAGNTQTEVVTDALDGGEILNGPIVIMAVDSMQSRADLFKYSLSNNPLIELAMDFRMGGNVLQCWAFDPRNEERFQKTLHSAEESVPATCGTRTFAPIGALSGVVATEHVTRFLAGNSVPYYTMIDMDTYQMFTQGFDLSESDSPLSDDTESEFPTEDDLVIADSIPF